MKKTNLEDLINCYESSPHPSFKVTNYFRIYTDLFSHLRGTDCTFIETGILNGGSLFMWRNWLGNKARVIGIDLNPEAKKWADEGFEIYIGDQGDPIFWKNIFNEIGSFDALLDDGGHQSFQQIVTLDSALQAATKKTVVVVEDTTTSFMKEFSGHFQYSFSEYCKDATDILQAKTNSLWPGQFPQIKNHKVVEHFSSVYSIEFFSGLIAFKIDPEANQLSKLCWNKIPEKKAKDFRYEGVNSALVEWPDLFTKKSITIKGGRST
jgi:hypothetical protein